MELVQMLTSQLGISDDQARGGTGLLLNMAKEKLGGGDFGALANAIPDASGMMAQAPSEGGGLMGAVGGMLGGDAGGMASLIGGFSKLGLDADMVQKFVPVVMQFLQEHGDGAAQSALSKLLG